MSELVVVSFDDKYKADEVLLELLKLERENLADLKDAVVITKNAVGKIRVKPYHDLVEPGDLSNELWGGIISAVFFHRALTIKEGVFDGSFLTEVEESLKPNSSSLFVIISNANLEKIIAEINRFGGKLIRTSFSQDKIDNLQKTLSPA
ncbi:hypothetical protein CDG77_13830 [Nostoc sp. 'Peltigera membranacea cyanobiont' 213]|uniref:DUF1269 domain-containing protein n=1 Tax=Nostoc cyanobionts TaxID=3123326 RepID=UPI000B95C3D4|nr:MULTISPECIES: DUF1269 domain-containing protein [unclassified Nostoc]AVH64212.1 membrane protein of uknown function DUF1269 [Nostoc sp. 'Peltigera membranacea cyanobiont' N6]OYD92827.1 hypothetical protein CDG77_13830 [Nostoc sp. 'Peltigera membranacea cyanobiont' 213]